MKKTSVTFVWEIIIDHCFIIYKDNEETYDMAVWYFEVLPRWGALIFVVELIDKLCQKRGTYDQDAVITHHLSIINLINIH